MVGWTGQVFANSRARTPQNNAFSLTLEAHIHQFSTVSMTQHEPIFFAFFSMCHVHLLMNLLLHQNTLLN
jgi:hypothetical protein